MNFTTRTALPALLLLASLTASAQQGANSPDAGNAIARIERRLNISSEQRVQIKSLLIEERPALQQLHTQLAAERSEIAEATANGNFDAVAVRSIAAKYAEANTDAMVEQQKLRAELLAILTPAQQQKLQKLRARFGAAVDARLQTQGDNL